MQKGGRGTYHSSTPLLLVHARPRYLGTFLPFLSTPTHPRLSCTPFLSRDPCWDPWVAKSIPVEKVALRRLPVTARERTLPLVALTPSGWSLASPRQPAF